MVAGDHSVSRRARTREEGERLSLVSVRDLAGEGSEAEVRR